jgi:hypothetical protein
MLSPRVIFSISNQMSMLTLFLGISCALLRGQHTWDYSTFLGGPGDDLANSVAVDDAGNTYVAGATSSIGFPFAPSETPGYYDFPYNSFLFKLATDGYLVFAKTISFGMVTAMLVDVEGNAYLAGLTTRSGFETTPGSLQPTADGSGQGFVMKVAPTGATMFATYLGGNGTIPSTIAIDGSRNIIVCGQARPGFIALTDSALPKTGTGFCSQLSADGSGLLFATLLGGSGLTFPTACTINVNGKLIVTGSTFSSDFPLKNAYQGGDPRKTLFRLNRGAQAWTAVGDSSLGTIKSIQFLPNSDRMLVAGGVVIKSDLDGGNLQRVPGFGERIAVHPRNGQYICAVNGNQLSCSTDGGQSWTTKAFSGINQVVADPRTEGGFYLATNQGLEYLPLLAGSIGPNLNFPIQANWMAIDPSGKQTVIWVSFGGILFRSLDSGSHFDLVDTPAFFSFYARFEVAPSMPSVLYSYSSQTGQPQFARSDDGGSTWKNIGAGFGPGFISSLVIDPQSASTVYIGSENGVFRSEDSGETWRLLDQGLTNGVVQTLQFDSAGNIWAGAILAARGFVMKLNIVQPALEFSTLLSGSGGASGASVIAREDGQVVVFGSTPSTDFPVTIENSFGGSPYHQMFMSVFDSSGQLKSSRLLGTFGAAAAFDSLGHLHVVGSGSAADVFPSDVAVSGTFRGGGTDGPWTRRGTDGLWRTIDLEAGRVIQATWIGGSGTDSLTAIAIGNDGKVRLVGITTSDDFPVSSEALQVQRGGQIDSLLAIIPLP